jgi:hypothetical protein
VDDFMSYHGLPLPLGEGDTLSPLFAPTLCLKTNDADGVYSISPAYSGAIVRFNTNLHVTRSDYDILIRESNRLITVFQQRTHMPEYSHLRDQYQIHLNKAVLTRNGFIERAIRDYPDYTVPTVNIHNYILPIIATPNIPFSFGILSTLFRYVLPLFSLILSVLTLILYYFNIDFVILDTNFKFSDFKTPLLIISSINFIRKGFNEYKKIIDSYNKGEYGDIIIITYLTLLTVLLLIYSG